ncbi:MAG: 16S rRNA (adenine(1518)-N(6)/adenine(1519)-N(6))-dimethyltransferase RsmA [Bacillota bacterium]|jgi:16S rRNA (adenine1518-N6/adenine1519-N6)-dimethyltransferase|nr:ribosomal RNA small subunit methyltransferase A [Bacillota bacterium]
MRRYGQHFLVCQEVRDSIVDAAAPGPRDLVLEIGPGKGALTAKLAERAGMVVAVEIDGHLVEALQKAFAGRAGVRIVHADVLECDIARLAREADFEAGRRLVVANLPYCITSPVLRQLLANSLLFDEFVLMVQMEVAERLVAGPGESGRSVLSLMAQYHTEPSLVMRVGPECFQPPPAVDSAVVRLKVRKRPAVDADPRTLWALVEAGFKHRRKTMRNAVYALLPPGCGADLIDRAFHDADVDPRLRAEHMSLDQFSALADAVNALFAACSR